MRFKNMQTKLYNKEGIETGSIDIAERIFGLPQNSDLIHQIRVGILANQRKPVAHSKNRAEVSGTGKKPWRQKGTGRARTGSIRNPIWRGGGTTFGPTGEQNYTKNMPKKMLKAAIAQSLSAKAENIKVIEKIALTEIKTQKALNLLAKVNAEGRVLMVVEKIDEKVDKSFANIPYVEITKYSELNVFDTLNADTIVIEKEVLKKIKSWLI